MKLIKIMLSLLCAAAMLLMAAGCSTVPANTVFSADDIPVKTIGLQPVSYTHLDVYKRQTHIRQRLKRRRL